MAFHFPKVWIPIQSSLRHINCTRPPSWLGTSALTGYSTTKPPVGLFGGFCCCLRRRHLLRKSHVEGGPALQQSQQKEEKMWRWHAVRSECCKHSGSGWPPDAFSLLLLSSSCHCTNPLNKKEISNWDKSPLIALGLQQIIRLVGVLYETFCCNPLIVWETLKQNNDVAQVENRLAVCGFAAPTDFSTCAALPEQRPWSGSQSGCQAPLRRLTESLQPIDSTREQQLASRHSRPGSPPHPTHRFGMFALSLWSLFDLTNLSSAIAPGNGLRLYRIWGDGPIVCCESTPAMVQRPFQSQLLLDECRMKRGKISKDRFCRRRTVQYCALPYIPHRGASY